MCSFLPEPKIYIVVNSDRVYVFENFKNTGTGEMSNLGSIAISTAKLH